MEILAQYNNPIFYVEVSGRKLVKSETRQKVLYKCKQVYLNRKTPMVGKLI